MDDKHRTVSRHVAAITTPRAMATHVCRVRGAARDSITHSTARGLHPCYPAAVAQRAQAPTGHQRGSYHSTVPHSFMPQSGATWCGRTPARPRSDLRDYGTPVAKLDHGRGRQRHPMAICVLPVHSLGAFSQHNCLKKGPTRGLARRERRCVATEVSSNRPDWHSRTTG